ncbi:hypothetical protein DY138_00820 [Apilactobacillus timberlakei]|uniref:hypothetical protein n=1 Tax=Apilactobacillus timberlakei TaxID=2008380 RepID=UPI00112E512F|nr:hypothetical protein [Apilactobacillus timberlakei]TPR20011.1 hypothetical protein DY138_00820 [Apilactobacillus timberlakei]TPR21729.1 hypothetical protein DY061_00735 [Apilactobacillus timberlakei]TPR22975.1 hypothetical protein DY083_02555 [Apilactobacillus timberlakei]
MNKRENEQNTFVRPRNYKFLNLYLLIDSIAIITVFIFGINSKSYIAILLLLLVTVILTGYFVFLLIYPTIANYKENKDNYNNGNPKGYVFSRYSKFYDNGNYNDETISKIVRCINLFYYKNNNKINREKYSKVQLENHLNSNGWLIKVSSNFLDDCINNLENGLSLYKDIVKFRTKVLNTMLTMIPIFASISLLIYNINLNSIFARISLSVFSLGIIFVKILTYGNYYTMEYENYKNLHNYLTTFKIILKNRG